MRIRLAATKTKRLTLEALIFSAVLFADGHGTLIEVGHVHNARVFPDLVGSR
jgi:hypothetical protein